MKSDVRKHEPLQSGTRRSRFRGSGYSDCECRVATGMAMTVRWIMLLPSGKRHCVGRLCQNDSWGETPVRRFRKLPLSDFLAFGRRGQIECAD